MQAIPLGLVSVPTAGTDVLFTLTAAQKTLLPASGLVAWIDVKPNPHTTGDVYVRSGGVTLAVLPAVANGTQFPWRTPHTEEGVNPLVFGLGAATNGDGAYVTLWVE